MNQWSSIKFQNVNPPTENFLATNLLEISSGQGFSAISESQWYLMCCLWWNMVHRQ